MIFIKGSLKKSDFNFELDDKFIAQEPIKNRELAKLLVLNREDNSIEHLKFKDIINFFNPGDTLVLNNTKVIPARLYGHRPSRDEKIEVLLLREVESDTWECLVKPGRKLKIDTEIIFKKAKLSGKIVDVTKTGTRLIKLEKDGELMDILEDIGNMPIPPYIKKTLKEKEYYQTVYSKDYGSSAAPTAGLHFTDELLEEIKNKGVNIAYVTLHIGLGTFSPMRVDNLDEHKMHSEYFIIDEKNANIINKTKKDGKNLIAVGTTSVRVLETVADENGRLEASRGETDIFIYPGYKFKIIDELITNFHLPESTLVMLVSAFYNRENILNAYEIAKKNDYKFFSFGNAMYIRGNNGNKI